jgi:hypothetical protein
LLRSAPQTVHTAWAGVPFFSLQITDYKITKLQPHPKVTKHVAVAPQAGAAAALMIMKIQL